VVCVNLQGLFIFCFHCVRNTTVRSEWMSVVSGIHTRRTAHSSADSDLATDSSTRVSSFFTAHQHIIGHFSAMKRTRPVPLHVPTTYDHKTMAFGGDSFRRLLLCPARQSWTADVALERWQWMSVVSRIQTYTTSTSNIDAAASSRSINPLHSVDGELDANSPDKDTRF